MRNLLLILLYATFIVGCGETLKNSWSNFRAYYNTYYNAQENFQAGFKKVQDQPVTIDPTKPVRIHHSPVQAGNSEFQKAIEKGAKVLRKFPDSKWIDDAILLIGKSYYYRQEFYPALQKFEELRNATSSAKMEQLSIIWKGRTLLDLNLNAEGITFLESELEEYPEEWSIGRKGEIQALAGEHHAMLGNWEESVNFLSNAVANITDKQLLGRAYFLYGQVLEQVERYGESYFSFSRVSKIFPGFEYSYWARFKQADIAREENNLDLAISIYEELSKDDKNVDRRGKLAFEVARTFEMKGEIAEAEKRYKDLLYGEQRQGIQGLRADIYYRLGKIYSEEYENLSIAAAYFDSSSTNSETLTRVEAAQDPQSLSDAFGEYKRLQNRINRADSLLRLGSLSPAELDSALERIRAQKRRKLLEQQESASEVRQTLANRNLTSSDNQNNTASSRYGFLNHRNADLVSQYKVEFRAIWGERPLVDNWRRIRSIQRSSVSRNQSTSERSRGVEGKDEKAAVVMDIQEIPRTPEAKEDLKHEKINAQYNLGNLLFLSLDSPDEARKYFYRVINTSDEVGQELRPRAMYSLYELFKTQKNQDSLRYWQNQILQEYPDSRYAQRVQNSTDTSPDNSEPDSTQKLVQQFQQIENSPGENKAAKLRKLALANRSSELAPHIHYQAIKAYIEQAKAHDKVADSLELSIQDMAAIPGSTKDTTQSVANVEEQFSFNSAYWDSVRSAVQEFDTTFSNVRQHKKVVQLLEVLAQGESSSQMPTCEELDISLSVKPDMDEFLSTVTYPEKVRDMSISGQVVYSFVVTPDGNVKSFELVSQRTSLGIEKAFERSFEGSLRFEPLKFEDPPPAIRCEVSFPIEL